MLLIHNIFVFLASEIDKQNRDQEKDSDKDCDYEDDDDGGDESTWWSTDLYQKGESWMRQISMRYEDNEGHNKYILHTVRQCINI